MKCKEGTFLRSLRSIDDWCWILRLWPQNFAIVPESLAPILKKVRQTSKVLIYFLLNYLQEYSKIWNIAKSNKSELWNHLSYRGLPYLFDLWPQWPQKQLCQIFLKMHQIAAFFPRINMTYILLEGFFEVDPNISSRHVWVQDWHLKILIYLYLPSAFSIDCEN